MSPIFPLLPRQSLFGGTNGTTLSGNSTLSSGDQTTNLWKYGIIAIVAAFGILTCARLIMLQRMRSRQGFITGRSPGWSFAAFSSQPAPPYTAHPEDSEAERRRLRVESHEVRRALENAGLIFRPPRSRSAMTGEMDVLNGVIPEFETEEMRSRRQRRERRERRRMRRLDEEEGAGLPTYSKDKAEGEEILETAEGGLPNAGDDVDSDDSDDEDLGAIPYELHPPAHPPHPITDSFPPSTTVPPPPTTTRRDLWPRHRHIL